ncbi:MFS general substrate transporter [Durotheca rogersii]|uniref:MFS general substrate transporter n=1 Tax=Durotheca rogersii TaxID=419775 RepID=UPI00221F80BF|nr:MFS general substrate transporter [Durotheca rogersii]KAI5868516.1 MFS general substrate transporter [Durotheca rogersii]
MVLTKQRSTRNPDDFPTVQLFILAIVRLAEPIALTSIFPYAWALVKRFKIGNEQDASLYAGLLISSFALAEALMGMYWGGLSDRIGRKPVLLLGCVGTMFSMVVVGFSTNIWAALCGRALGGLLNGNIGVIQTMVGELVTKPEHEPRAYSVMPFVWSIGTIIGPAIGGILADPHESYPGTFPKGSLFADFPYLLPNLCCAALLLVSICLGYFLLEETHPDMAPRVMLPDDTYVSDETPLMETSDAIKQPAVDLRSETYGTFRGRNSVEFIHDPVRPKEPKGGKCFNIFTRRIMALVIALSIFTYHSMTYDHLLPIFFEDERVPIEYAPGGGILSHFNPLYSPGGLGLSVQSVGFIMAINGAIALFVQVVVFPLAAEIIGVFRLFILATILHPVVYAIVPTLVHLPDSLLYVGIYFCLAVRNVFSIILYPLLLILIKEATPCPSVLGKVNGFAASAGAACRMVAPPVAGYLYTIGSQIDCTGLAWYGSTLVAIVGAFQCFSVKCDRKEDVSEETGRLKPVHGIVTVTEVTQGEEDEGPNGQPYETSRYAL